MVKVTINGRETEVAEGTNLVQAAEAAGQEIPHYCYHPGLSVAGNCRMCLVEIKALSAKQANPLPKLQIGCNTIVQEGMVVETDNPRVREARRGVLEFLLINHPIDCPICDQAGECKLQEYYMDYGRHLSRFALEEKVSKRKALAIGPDVMLDQERCILCTRCVRFLDEITETHELTITERGDHSELTLAAGASVDNDYAANIVDICPVGALTSREFRFQARVWYLEVTDSICSGCATGCNVTVHSRRGEIFRLKPRANAEVNGYWMCDHGRRTYLDNADQSRLRASLSREGEGFVEQGSKAIAARAALTLKACTSVAVVASASLSMEEAFLLARIQEMLGGGERVMTSPASSEVAGDDKLICSDRYPNRRGMQALGYQPAARLTEPADGLIIVRSDPVGDDKGGWEGIIEQALVTVVAADRSGQSLAYADHIVAISSHFESAGSFINRSGRIQRFEKAVDAPGGAVAGWLALAQLLEALGGEVFADADDVLAAVLKRLTGDDRADAGWVGADGRPLGAQHS